MSPQIDAGGVAVKDSIIEQILTSGSVSFAEFMHLALYQPPHGYYLTHEPTLDYQSSPNVHPVFGAMVARQLAQLWRLLDCPGRFQVFEAGAGSGRLAIDILESAAAAEPEFYAAIHYVVQDVTFGLPEAAETPVGTHGRAPLRHVIPDEDKLSIAADLPGEAQVEGCILSNELLDALPFHRVRRRDGRLLEIRVGYADGRFVDVEAEPDAAIRAYFDALGRQPAEGCDAEVCLEAPAWMGRAARALRRGYVLSLDYGYEAESLYAPWRKRGTLLTFYRHTAGEDPYVRVGEQDITASVDFTSVMRAGEAAGLQTLGLTSQTDFLAALGIGGTLAQGPRAGDLEAYYALRRSVIELTRPDGLGRICVLLQGRDVPDLLPAGFVRPAESD
jgi:SAM-dependent MidA family methyltransferase